MDLWIVHVQVLYICHLRSCKTACDTLQCFNLTRLHMSTSSLFSSAMDRGSAVMSAVIARDSETVVVNLAHNSNTVSFLDDLAHSTGIIQDSGPFGNLVLK